MNDNAQKTPLVDLLRSVPKSHRTEWETQWAEDGAPTGHAMCPIGKLCHDAADLIDELEGVNREITALYNRNTGAVAKLRKVKMMVDESLAALRDES